MSHYVTENYISEYSASQPEARNLAIRIVATIGWLILIYFASNMLIGGIVGAVAGTHTSTYQEGYAAGTQASVLFFQKYGLFVLAAQLLVFVGLLVSSKLPGTTKFKNRNVS